MVNKFSENETLLVFCRGHNLDFDSISSFLTMDNTNKKCYLYETKIMPGGEKETKKMEFPITDLALWLLENKVSGMHIEIYITPEMKEHHKKFER